MIADPRRTRVGELVGLVLLVIMSASIVSALDSRAALDCDVVNLALAIDRFDVREHQPHPPGYLPYVLLLRLLSWVSGLPAIACTKLLARIFAVVAIITVFVAARRAVARSSVAREGSGLVAALLVATHPILLYYAVDGQTHAAECAAAAALCAVFATPRAATFRAATWVALLVAAGASLRPSFALLAIGPLLWFFARRPALLLWITALVAALSLSWIVPTVELSGGLEVYRLASESLYRNFSRVTSLLSAERDLRYVALNLRSVAVWSGFALAPLLVALAWRLARAPRTLEAVPRHTLWLLLLMAAPALSFYAVIYCAEAGYLVGFVPPAAIAVAVLLSRGLGGRVMAALLAAAQLVAFLAGPSAELVNIGMTPTLDEVLVRSLRVEMMLDRVAAGATPSDRLLMVTDYPDNTLARQLPLARPLSDALILHSPRRSMLLRESLSLATATGWQAVPGPALLAPGDLRTLLTTTRYQLVVVDHLASDGLRAALRAQTPCTIAAADEAMSAVHLGATECFPQGMIELSGLRLQFGVAPR